MVKTHATMDEHIEWLGQRFRDGERTNQLLFGMTLALRSVERGEADPSWGRELEAAIAHLHGETT